MPTQGSVFGAVNPSKPCQNPAKTLPLASYDVPDAPDAPDAPNALSTANLYGEGSDVMADGKWQDLPVKVSLTAN